MEELYSDFADYYDLIYREKNYLEEVEFIVEKFREKRSGGDNKALIIGCGTGSHAQYLQEKGFSIKGIDKHQEMIEIAREKSNAEFSQGTLPGLDINKKYDLILLPFTVVNFLDDEELRESLNELQEYLSENGVLIFDNDQILQFNGSYTAPYIELNEDIARISQFHRKEDFVELRSIIFTGKNQIFNKYEVYCHEDEEIKSLLMSLGLEVEIFDGYTRQEDNLTVFVAF